jgi:hypothetical protein
MIMKTLRTKKFFAAASLTAAALALAPLGRAQPDKTESKGVETPAVQQHQADLKASRGAIVTAVTREDTKDLKDHTVKKLAGRHIRGADAKDLGEVKDFLVEPSAGSVRYAVVSSGGIGGMGAKLRLVPFESLKPSGTKNDEFTLAVDKAQWEQLPVIEDKEFKNGRFTVTDAQRRQLASFDRPSPTTATQPSATASADINAYLIRASDLDGKELHSGTMDLGKIESVLIDSSGQVTALVDPKSDLARANTKFIVPVSLLQVAGGKREPVTTTLTRTEFEAAQQVSASTTTTTAVPATSASTDTTVTAAPATTTAAAPKTATEQDKLAVAVTDTDKSLSTAVTPGTTTSTTAGTITSTTAGTSTSNIPATTSTTTTSADQSLSATGRMSTEARSNPTASTDTTSTTVRTEDKVAVASSDKKATADQTETSADLKISKTDDHSQATEASRSASNTSNTSSATVASADKTTTADKTERTEQSQDLAAVSGSKEKTSSAAGETKELAPTGRTEEKSSSVASTEDKSSTKSSATTTDLVGVDASKDSVAATEKSSAATKTVDDPAPAPAKSTNLAANETTINSAPTDPSADQKKSDIGSTDQSSTKVAGNIASDSAIKGKETADQQLTPTGKQSSDAIPAGTDPALATAAQSIRKAFDDDADLSKLQITITPENGKVVLRGTVSDPMQKNAIDKKAREGANGQPIDNQIMMQKDGGK